MNKITINTLFSRFKKKNPSPTTELYYESTFQLLIAVILSAQATDISVNKATKLLFNKANTPEKILALGENTLKSYLKTIGLYHTKTEYILKTCQQLIEKHQSRVPSTRAELEALPGVGRKTANVVLNTAFGEATIAVDTHIFRVAKRIGLSNGKTPRKVEDDLTNVIPKKYLNDAHHWLILQGRYVCTARKPQCSACIIRDLCEYPDKTE